mmetsp:Transcript_84239/g.238717  ORF Transcript_84239/g.238717 Transcript_84239/m.238717 type:complete len:247 (+) Transcript_84239:3269-4009(+)
MYSFVSSAFPVSVGCVTKICSIHGSVMEERFPKIVEFTGTMRYPHMMKFSLSKVASKSCFALIRFSASLGRKSTPTAQPSRSSGSGTSEAKSSQGICVMTPAPSPLSSPPPSAVMLRSMPPLQAPRCSTHARAPRADCKRSWLADFSMLAIMPTPQASFSSKTFSAGKTSKRRPGTTCRCKARLLLLRAAAAHARTAVPPRALSAAGRVAAASPAAAAPELPKPVLVARRPAPAAAAAGQLEGGAP